jgi:nucleoside phosphorylase
MFVDDASLGAIVGDFDYLRCMGLKAIGDLLAEAKARGWRIALVLTALDLELQAVMAHLVDVISVAGRDGNIYECGVFREDGQEWLVVLIETGAGNHAAQSAVTNAHIAFSPDLQIFVGVAGSRKKDVPIGSVVAASLVYSPYGGKYDEKGFSARPREYHAHSRLLEVARKVRRDKKWPERIRDLADRKLPIAEDYPCPLPPIAEVAPAISTEAVSASKESDLEALIATHYGDACVVEMEGYGSLFAAQREDTPAIVIRGVSDMAAEKDSDTDKLRQPVAAAHAAAFAFELISWWSSLYPSAPSTLSIIKPAAPVGPAPEISAKPSATVSGARYVLNLDAEVGAVSAERIAAIEAMLRDLSGDPGITVERIEEGSLRLIIRDPSAALEAIGPTRLRQELNASFALHLLGLVPEHSLDELGDVAEELRLASHDLLSWPDTLPDGEQFARPELDQLLTLAGARDRSVTALIGDPGSGKSALLATLGKRLVEAGHPVLAIKADLLDIEVTNEADLRERLGLSDRPSVLLERLAALRPTYLLIDQLDALAGYLDLRTGRLNALLNLVRRLGKTDNIHIILSARRFEYEHDVRLRTISADSLVLQLPGWSQVLELLESKSIAAAGWPIDAQEVLRSPQALAIYLQLDEKVRSEPLLSYQAMLDHLWDERVLQGPDGARRSRVATQLADQMADEESLWLPKARLDEVKDDIDWLVRIGVLTPNSAGSSVGFAHQTMFDYALARAFAMETGQLSAFIFERQTSIFCRPKVWAGLTYLRGANLAGYAEEIAILWNAQGLRRHLRFLQIEFLGQQHDPIDVEEALIVSAFANPDEQALVLRAIAGSPGWFERLMNGPITQAMTSDGPVRDWVSPVLSAAVEFAPDAVAELINEHWLPTGADDYRAWSILQNAPVWSERMIEMGVTLLARAQIAPLYLDHLAGSLGLEQPQAALRLVRAALDRSLRAAIAEGRALAAEPMPNGLDPTDEALWRVRHDGTRAIKNILETSNEWDMLRALAEHAPADTIELLWPWFVETLEALQELRDEGRDRPLYNLQFEADFRFDGENGLDLPQPSIPSALRIALETLAADAPEAFRAWMDSAQDSEFAPVHRLIAHTMCVHAETYECTAFRYILGDARRWSLGSIHDYSGTSTGLVTAAAPYWDQDQIATYEAAVRSYSPPVPADLDNPEGRRIWLNIQRKHRLQLLRALPSNRRTRDTANLVRSEERAIGDSRMGASFSGVYSPTSIMSAVDMSRASDEDIINAFRSLPDATRWDHPKYRRKGGNIQLSREFARFAKDNPDRAMRLIERFEPEFGERAAGSAISDMAAAADPARLQAMIVDLAGRGFQGDEFQSYVANAIESLLSADAAIRPEIIDLLRGWLLATPAREAGAEDPESEDDISGGGEPNDDDPEGRSLLWGYGGLSVVPGGPFPLLHILARYYLVIGDHGALRDLLAACLPLGFDSKVWAHLLALLRHLRPREGEDAQAGIDLLSEILRRHPELVGSREVAFLFGHLHWWAPELVEQALPSWAASDRRAVRQGYGELVALLALLHPDREWPKGALGALERGVDSDAKAGAAITAVNLWADQSRRAAATALLVRIIPNAGDAEWKAIFELFRVVSELVPDESTSLLLEAIADNADKAPTVGATFVVERLQSLLPHEATLVARLATIFVEKWQKDLADIRTGTAAHASELVDLAITLHRLGPATRESGTHLFEMLLNIDAYEARATLDQIDSRFRPTAPIRRPRLQRRPREHSKRRRLG